MINRHEMPFGERPTAGNERLFSLWAPAAKTVALIHGETGGAEKSTATPAMLGTKGWWNARVQACSPGASYQWQIDDALKVPDPASRYNPDGPHQPSCVTDSQAYQWQTDWRGRPWHELVFYELHVGSFTPEGTYSAAAMHLPRLAALGFTAIELMPLATFAGEWGWGYDGVLPFAPHPAYGSPDDLKHLVDDAHALGICVFIDVVYNHFGPDGNYLGAYAPAFFSTEHQSPWGAAINFDQAGSEEVRSFFGHNALYWVDEFRMDGLRLDAVHAIVDDSRPDILQEISTRVRDFASHAGRAIHLVLENDRNQAERLTADRAPGLYDGQWNDDFHHALHVTLTGETQGYYAKFGQDPVALLALVLTHGFAFPHGHSESSLQTSSPPSVPLGSMLNFMGNHDQVGNRAFGERLAHLVPEHAAELALLLSLLTPATPMVFMGDEFDASTPFLYFAQWEGELRDAVREGRQREFSHAVPDGQQLPDPCDIASLHSSQLRWEEAAGPKGAARSGLVQQALQARREWLQPLALRLNVDGHAAERIGAWALRVHWHYAGGSTIRLEVNLSESAVQAKDLPLPPGFTAREIFSIRRLGDASVWPPWSARWMMLSSVNDGCNNDDY
ncbi:MULTISPECIES: malto-oligosyltrehalose trehalohydrolase [unclassified Acidovorax]|uniref:malto-oligosyltrehalose trehalohydrolase n=1 Tax=unclassified Acidovorax TaxID=2684926 RepID=UPI002882EF4C|nr:MULTISPECIES: malto-oligosyltrehalose trehalohydrolase [unclassified Acidovorax]